MTTPAQPPVNPAASRPLRAWTDFDRLTQRREDDPKIIGSAILLTILLHAMLFFWILPWVGNSMQISRYASDTPARPTPPPVEYVLTPLTPADQQALKYVEANPNAPVAKPVATNNISDRDQRVAQPTPNPGGHSDKPQTDGQMLNTQKIVQGDRSRPAPAPSPPTPPTPPAQKPAAAKEPTAPVVAAQPPALAAKPTATDGDGIRLEEKPLENPADKPTESPLPPTVATTPPNPRLRPGPLTPDVVAESAAEATPESRPSLNVKTHAGPIIIEKQGANTHEIASVDSKLTQFGAYSGMVLDAIESQWDIECENYSFDLRDAGTAVEVNFLINSKGEISELQVANSTASRGPTQMCVNAIKLPAPYGPWSKEMIALLGESTTFRITFYYQ